MKETGISACEHTKEKDMAVMLYVQTYKPNKKAKDEIAKLVANKPAPSIPDNTEKPHTHPPGFVHDEDKEKAQRDEIDAEI